MWAVALATALFLAFEVAAVKWGDDSRPTGDWRAKTD